MQNHLCVPKFCATAAMFAFALVGMAQSVKSPNGELELNFSLDEQGRPTYTLALQGKTLIAPSHLGYQLKKPGKKPTYFEWTTPETTTEAQKRKADLATGFTLFDHKVTTGDETWKPVWGEESSIRNHYNELWVSLDQNDNMRKLNLRFRLFDDGLGFRYEFPDQPSFTYFTVAEELTEFAMTGDHTAWWVAGD